MLLGDKVKRVFISGGAGFIGSHVTDMLLPQGYQVTVYDNLSNGRREYIQSHIGKPNFQFIQADLLDLDRLKAAVAGHDLVWHLAANTDIIGSHEQPNRDLKDSVMTTFNMVEAMRQTSIQRILFASSGAVYGNLCAEVSVTEAAGPLQPVSTYGAGKIGSEAFISSFCHVYGLRAWMFRFGNVVGARMTHGVIYDFVHKLRNDPTQLLIRGDGRQEKNYFLVEECIDGMAYGLRSISLTDDKPCDVFNLGTTTISRVVDIAHLVRDEMGLSAAKIKVEGTRKAWPGDQPRVHFTVDKMTALGWQTKFSSDQSVRCAAQRMLGNVGPLEVGAI